MAPRTIPHALISSLMLAAIGCSQSAPVKGPERLHTQQKRYQREAKRIEAEPVAYLQEVRHRCEQLAQYTMTFYRQERLGLPRRLKPMEEIRATFRAAPFSVKFEWDDPARDFFESVYVAGQNDDKLIVRERHGMPLGFIRLRPQVRVVRVVDSIIWGKAKNPVTDFGLARVMQRTLKRFEDPATADKMGIAYAGVVHLETIQRPAHHLRIDLPPIPGVACNRQDFYIDAETLLPAGTDLWLPNGDLDARYRYTNVQTAVQLTDADFRLSVEHPFTQPAK